MKTEKLINAATLTQWTARMLDALGVPAAYSRFVAESLIAANLRGVDSHGVHLLPYYAEHLRRGLIKPRSEGHIVTESAACLVYDGEQGLGQVVSRACTDHAIRLARRHGVGMVTARNSNHFGAAAFWGQRISAAGMIGMVTCNASPSVSPWQGREGRIGTNPICVSTPSSGRGGWLLDMATTTVAKNKLFRAEHNRQETLPAGWALDEDGVPTTETARARLLSPLGGYKGSGLGLLVEILCGVLGGGAMCTELGGTYIYDRKMATSQFFLAIDVGRLLPLEQFQSRMEKLVTTVKSTPPAKGYDEVLVAGEPEWRLEAERLKNGIPIDEGTWERFDQLARTLGVPMPPK